MSVTQTQKLVMYALSYFTILNYAFILIALFYAQNAQDKVNSLILIFGIGSLISIIASIIIIRDHLEQDKSFAHTLIKLAIAHFPAVTAFALSLILFI